MNPNFIDTLAAGETWPSWLPYLFLALFVVATIGSLLLYLRWKGQDFRRDRDAASIVFDSLWFDFGADDSKSRVLMALGQMLRTLPEHTIWVRVIPEKQYDTALHEADDTVGQGMRISGTVSGPRHEYGARWVTRLLGGETDVYTITVRDRADDPGGAQALVHELTRHLWPHLKGYGWNREDGPHDGHRNAKSDKIAAELQEVLR